MTFDFKPELDSNSYRSVIYIKTRLLEVNFATENHNKKKPDFLESIATV